MFCFEIFVILKLLSKNLSIVNILLVFKIPNVYFLCNRNTRNPRINILIVTDFDLGIIHNKKNVYFLTLVVQQEQEIRLLKIMNLYIKITHMQYSVTSSFEDLTIS